MAQANFKSRVLKEYAPPPGEAPVEPWVYRNGPAFFYRVTPTDVWQKSPEPLRRFAARGPGGFAACKNETDSGLCTRDARVTVALEELLYPGNRSEPLSGKYVYVVRTTGKALVAEVHAVRPGIWMVLSDPSASAEPEQRKLRGPVLTNSIDLPPDAYSFFLSPVRLTAAALRYLLDHLAEAGVRQNLQGDAPVKVCIPDPVRWAEDAHDLLFQPCVAEYLAFVNDVQVQSARAVHDALSGWINYNNDALDLEDELNALEFDNFKEEYPEREKQLMQAAEAAGGYLAGWLDSTWHRTVEVAAQTTKDPFGVALFCSHWAYICRDLPATERTRLLMEGLAADTKRFIRTHVLYGLDGAPSPWGETPSTASAEVQGRARDPAIKWFKSIGGTIATIWLTFVGAALKLKVHNAVAGTKNYRDALSKDLSNTLRWIDMADDAVAKSWRHSMWVERLWDDLIADMRKEAGYDPGSPSADFHLDPMDKLKLNKSFGRWKLPERLAAQRDVQMSRLKDADKIVESATEESSTYKSRGVFRSLLWAQPLKVSLDAVLTVVCLRLDIAALVEQYKTNQSGAGATALSASRTGLGLAKSILDTTKYLLELGKDNPDDMIHALTAMLGDNKTAVARVTKTCAVLGIIGGVYDIVGRTRDGYKEVGRFDYGAAAGYGIVIVGTALSIYGSVLAIKAAATTGATAGAAAGPEGVVAGAVIGVSAATLVLIGTAVVAKARKSEFEDFARFSIFGNRDEYIDVDWSDTRLCRDQRPYWQLRTLKLLLAQFTLAREGDGSPRIMDTKITLHAGFLEPGCYFVVHIVQEYTNGFGPAYERPFTTSLIIFPEARRMSQPSREREAFEMSVESVSDFEFLGDPAKGEVQVRIPIKPVTFYVPDGAGVRAVSSGDFPGRCVSSEIRVKLRNRGEDSRLPDVPTDGHSWVRLDTMSGPSSISSFAASKFYKSES